MNVWLTWRAAIEQALYGENGFYLRERPSGHFRTSVEASPVFAEAVLRELVAVDDALGRPRTIHLVDIGAGEGRLAAGVLAVAPPELRSRLRVIGVDLAPRPARLPEEIEWACAVPDGIHGLVIANEWLDNIPVDIAEQTADGPRLVLVDPASGEERLGDRPRGADLAWLSRWWPMRAVGERAEIGRPRDEAWASVIVRLARGRAIAIDYAHSVDDRPPYGTLAGYRDGAIVAPVPDGSCDITAHVALDACAAAGERAGATTTALTTQRQALRALGVTGARPPAERAHSDPRGYLQALARASEEAELIASEGLGGFGWLAQEKPARALLLGAEQGVEGAVDALGRGLRGR
ncbi:SAM-dependent methyltransferase [Streptosporangium sp. NPDC000396]|uniref:SAM-dependent methyltransferase n=1 Tax=Streptosporangium sp. NPDC000396 TaxID=3366185 RepID=UPI0036BE7B10